MPPSNRRRLGKLLAAAVVLAAAVPAGILGLFLGYSRSLPSVEELQSYHPGLVTTLYDIKDRPFAHFYIERREIVPLENIPHHLQQAVVAVEDANFFSHQGIDPAGIIRATVKNLLAGGVVQGGSTITQQVARAVFLNPERKLTRKIKEAILAWRLEREFSKKDILWLYLNHIYFGHGAYGIESAARTYFGKHVDALTLAECAFLAGLPKAPSHYSPFTHPESARMRRRQVLNRMVEEKYISQAEMEAALAVPLLMQRREGDEGRAAFFTEHIRRYLEKTYGSDLLYRGGLRVYTTLDTALQEQAERAVKAGVREVDKRRGYHGPIAKIDPEQPDALERFIKGRSDWPDKLEAGVTYPGIVLSIDDPQRAKVRVGPAEGWLPLENMAWAAGQSGRPPAEVGWVVQPGYVVWVKVEEIAPSGRALLSLEQEPDVEGALLCLDPGNGQVLAMVGGYDYNRNQFNRAVQSRRQPGSAFKPFIYAAAIEKGWSPADIIIDSPIVFRNLDEEAKLKKWKPENYDEVFSGPIRLREALNQSRNLPTIKLLQKIGLRPVLDLSSRLGIRSPLAHDLSLALGSSGVTLLELTAAYAVFANGGIHTPPMFIRSITDRRGTLLEFHQPRPRRVIAEDSAYIINSMLQTVVEDGTGQRVKALNRPAAGKTGTTNEYLDAWFMGFTPQLVAGVWVGLDEEKPIGPKETGSRAAAPLWLAFMEEAVKKMPVEVFSVPATVVFVKVDADSSLLAAPNSPKALFEVFRRGDEPRRRARPEAKTSTDFMRMDLSGPDRAAD